MIVGIDVGNTAIKWVTDQKRDRVESVRPGLDGTLRHLAADLMRATADADCAEIRIASVNRSSAAMLESGLRVDAPGNWTIRPITRADVPIKANVDYPERVGIDRLVGAYGASLILEMPLVIVDAGTTVTVDYVDEQGEFQGGAIMPGLMMQTASLARGTDALPDLEWQASCCGESDEQVPGKNTIAAIRLGVLSSVAGGVTRLIESYGNPRHVIVTGGDAACLSKALKIAHQIQPHLVCRTLLKLPPK
ncbi:type III pantothenate kinase [Neorhodopirellula pilleata]|uniref:Type III pantothenate kinase n=1 Tax=Neorhodopirellula pilleata TaxID=2714738 RepID=A0A5C6ARF5_9BACT|nr:type III pantothenate kinase [Neorhodopirellula pilleata]TWU02061.1 Type III pantothenate kinase [Neorhodopirellula pilleata]